MANGDLIQLEDAMKQLPRRPGLVLGSGATIIPGATDSTSSSIVDLIPKEHREAARTAESISVLMDIIKAEEDAVTFACEQAYRQAIQNLQPSLELAHVARVQWSAILSITVDLLFESSMRNHLDGVASTRSLTVVDSPATAAPPRSTIVYKLLGNILVSDPKRAVAYGLSDIAAKEAIWPALVKAFVDNVRNAPILFLGTDSSLEFVRKILALVFGGAGPKPGHVLFLKDDDTASDPSVRALLNKNTKYFLVDASLRDFCNAVADLKPAQSTFALSTPTDATLKSLRKDFEEYSTYVSLVPNLEGTDIDVELHRPSLVDALFRPLSVDWSPYAANLDLARDVTSDLVSAIKEVDETYKLESVPSVILRGEAAVGKTIVMKRAAVDLVNEGYIVVWCRRSPTDNWYRQYRKIATRLASHIKDKKNKDSRLVVFCDDPWAARLSAQEVASVFEAAHIPTICVFGFRNSDYLSADGTESSMQSNTAKEIEVPHKLSDGEKDGLGRMLVSIGAAKNESDASTAIACMPKESNADDVLCSLWYLVPETQSQITASLQDEYARLGLVDQSIESVAEAAKQSGESARLAYELVTVTSSLNLGIPIEVLVGAIGIDYADWIAMCTGGRPVWGLIYDDEDPSGETIVYRTRNNVVTKVLLRLVNGGIGHAGEFARLKDLVRACSGGTLVYRNFIADLLARSRKRLQDILTYAQGLELYEIAEEVLPHPDRIVAHHKGLWIHHVGRKPDEAYSQLEKALATPQYPGAVREEPTEFIHTSMAATVVQEIRSGSQDREAGLETVKGHLQQATRLNRFDPHMTHVFANMLFEIAKRGGGYAALDSVAFSSFVEAIQEIESALQTIGSSGKSNRRFNTDIVMLTSLQKSIFDSLPDSDDLESSAASLFKESGSQVGLEVAARRQFLHASGIDKGKAYNEAHNAINRYFEQVTDAGRAPSVGMHAARADLIIRWRLQRTSGQTNWQQLKDDLEAVLAAPRHREDIIKSFYLAVAEHHLDDIANSNTIFARLRRETKPRMMPHEIRAFYCSREGFPKRVQGEVVRRHGKSYAVFSELGTEVLVSRTVESQTPGTTEHFYIGFALNGPVAVLERPFADELELPEVFIS